MTEDMKLIQFKEIMEMNLDHSSPLTTSIVYKLLDVIILLEERIRALESRVTTSYGSF